ncbi:hypothetical protein CR513_62628, partial [Mucuna pruriens]
MCNIQGSVPAANRSLIRNDLTKQGSKEIHDMLSPTKINPINPKPVRPCNSHYFNSLFCQRCVSRKRTIHPSKNTLIRYHLYFATNTLRHNNKPFFLYKVQRFRVHQTAPHAVAKVVIRDRRFQPRPAIHREPKSKFLFLLFNSAKGLRDANQHVSACDNKGRQRQTSDSAPPFSTTSHIDKIFFFNFSKSARASTNVARTVSSSLGGKGRSFKHRPSLFSLGNNLDKISVQLLVKLTKAVGALITVLSKKGCNSGAKDFDSDRSPGFDENCCGFSIEDGVVGGNAYAESSVGEQSDLERDNGGMRIR